MKALSSLVSPSFVKLLSTLSVGEAIAQVRKSARRGDIVYLYVVDGAERLTGVVSIRNLLLAQDHETVAAITTGQVVTLTENTSWTEALALFSKSRFLSLPFLTCEGKILGVLHAHTLLGERKQDLDALFEERSRGELFELLGIRAETLGQGVFATARERLPWLLVNLIGGALSAVAIHSLGGKLPNAVAALAFVPILLIVSESIGMQTASLVITSLHRAGQKSLMARELAISLLLGLGCGALVSGGAYLWQHDWSFARPIGITVALGATWVSAIGQFIPSLIHRLRIDPRVAAGPVVLAVADFSTLLLYLLLANFF